MDGGCWIVRRSESSCCKGTLTLLNACLFLANIDSYNATNADNHFYQTAWRNPVHYSIGSEPHLDASVLWFAETDRGDSGRCGTIRGYELSHVCMEWG
jgi:hypothetical protein